MRPRHKAAENGIKIGEVDVYNVSFNEAAA